MIGWSDEHEQMRQAVRRFVDAEIVPIREELEHGDAGALAVQLHGGNGYMAEYHVEQLARDAKVFQIYAGTDEQQIIAIAKDLMRR